MLTLVMWHNRFSENENEAVEAHVPQHRYSKTKKPWHRDSKAKKPRHRETETINPRHRDSKAFFQRSKSHGIEIPRPKTTKSRFQDQKATIWSSCGILTLMPPDSSQSCRYFQVDSQKNAWILGSETWKYLGCDHKCDFGKACTPNSLQNINRRIAEYLFFQLFIY